MNGVLSGLQAAVIGGGVIAGAMAERIGSEGGRVVMAPTTAELGDDVPEAALVSLQDLRGGANEAAAALDGVIALVRDNPGLRRVVVIGVEGPGASLARTLSVYATAHTADRDVRVNALAIARTIDDDTRDEIGGIVTALLSGLLDAVRGQTFELGSEAPR